MPESIPNPFGNNYSRNQGGGVRWAGGTTNFRLVWHDREVVQQTDAIFRQAMVGLEAEALKAGQQFQQGHIRTGDLVSKLYAVVDGAVGSRIVLHLGSSSEHAIYEELGTRFRPGHPNLRRALDYMVPRLKTALAEAYARAR
jgi:hypothetical protein